MKLWLVGRLQLSSLWLESHHSQLVILTSELSAQRRPAWTVMEAHKPISYETLAT